MFFPRRKKQVPTAFDTEGKIPVIRSSICTGEQVAGFQDPATGKFQELMLIRNDRDLRAFLREYQVDADQIRREW